MIKKIYFTLLLFTSTLLTIKPCGGGDWYEYDYNGLILSQELINSPGYFPFLLDLNNRFYTSADTSNISGNGNILEWSKYLNINYDDAYYLVFKSTEADIDSLLQKKKISNSKLQFANSYFVNKYKEGLEYLSRAKDFEYLTFSGADPNDWNSYEDENSYIDAGVYSYTKTVKDLQKRWTRSKDKEIKLRYGYQLVRFAHYNKEYAEAVSFFDSYIEPLNYKSEIYYYALSQKAGAMRGLGDIIESNKLFTDVFFNSKDLKETAIISIQFNEGANLKELLTSAKTVKEKNDADLLLGFLDFSNPLASASKIIARSPDAIQAKVLVARAIAQLDFIDDIYSSKTTQRRYPILSDDSQKQIDALFNLVQEQATSPNVKNKNYWNITLAYLYFVQRQFDKAEEYLAKVDQSEKGYTKQKAMLASYIDVAKIPVIDAAAENKVLEKYISKSDIDGRSVIISILANRYYLQKEYAKSFMLTCSLNELMDNPNMTILNDIDAFYNAPNKSKMEQYLCDNFKSGLGDKISVMQLVQYMRGILYLTDNKLYKAKTEFDKSSFSLDTIPSDIFGYNQIECFTCGDNMEVDYLNEFPYIKKEMNEKQLVDVLIKLEEQANKNNAKANYLLGNFFYNTSLTGYFRNFLRLGYQGEYRQQFFDPKDKNGILTDLLYFKFIPTYYDNNTTNIADIYLKKAYTLASGNEFKARIVFALSKTEQELNYQRLSNNLDRWSRYSSDDWVMISDRKYFKEMMKYKNTNFFKQVQSNCLYFDFYVNNL